ncbi:hypothetical protein HHI36_006477, partial [Cryptolaemus montrouzieri]
MNRGANGATSREERSEPDSRTRDSRNSLGEADACPALNLRRPDGHMRWSNDDNIALMRMHYIAMDPVNRSDKIYQELLTEYWNGAHPDRELYIAKRTTRPLVEISREERRSLGRRSTVGNVRRRRMKSRHQNREKSIEDALTRISLAICLTETGPEISCTKTKIFAKSTEMDAVLAKKLEHTTSLAVAADLVYAGAVAVCAVSGVQIKTQKSPTGLKNEPVWSTRLKGKIVNIWKKVGVLHTYFNTAEPSQRLLKSVREIASQFSLRPKD